MSHDPDINEPHSREPNPHDHGLRTTAPKRSKARQLLYILMPLGFILLVGAMLLTAGVTDEVPHSGAQAPPAVQQDADGEGAVVPAN